MVSLENFSLKVFPKWDKMPCVQSIENKRGYQLIKLDPRDNTQGREHSKLSIVVPGEATPYQIEMCIKTSFQLIKRGALLN